MSSLKMLAEFEALRQQVEALEKRVAQLEDKRKVGRPRKPSEPLNTIKVTATNA